MCWHNTIKNQFKWLTSVPGNTPCLESHVGPFQYVCDSEQMLSLFGCRVSNVLDFECCFMLDILAGYFSVQKAMICIIQTFNLWEIL